MSQPDRFSPRAARERIRVGVSACLLGQKVRYDGRHKRDAVVVEQLSECFELIPVCPEVAIGLGTPREPIHLTGSPAAPRAVGAGTGSPDVTDLLAAYGHRMAGELAGISGYIFKSRSPSCGVARVPIHGGARGSSGRGIYASAIIEALPRLPVEEEGRLQDPALRERFVERVHAYHRRQHSEGTP